MSYFFIAVMSLIGGWIGSFLGAYLKKKGENLATHEDVDKLVAQVAAVTQTTKEIESKISSEVWNRQKRWELKREVLFEGVQRLSDSEDALSSLHAVFQVEHNDPEGENVPSWYEEKSERLKRWRDASAEFDETRVKVSIACGMETVRTFYEFGSLMNVTSGALIKNGAEAYAKSQPDIAKKSFAVMAAVRKELGIDGPG